MPAHDWEDVRDPWVQRSLTTYGRRRCSLCGAEQSKEQHGYWWGRVAGYRWEPLAGRCPGEKL